MAGTRTPVGPIQDQFSGQVQPGPIECGTAHGTELHRPGHLHTGPIDGNTGAAEIPRYRRPGSTVEKTEQTDNETAG